MSAEAPQVPTPRRNKTVTERISYWSIVWEQLRKNRIAVFGLWCIGALVLLAVYAPFLSLDQPLVWRDATGWSSPLFAGLFNRLLFENVSRFASGCGADSVETLLFEVTLQE